jgi:hypothetical protein
MLVVPSRADDSNSNVASVQITKRYLAFSGLTKQSKDHLRVVRNITIHITTINDEKENRDEKANEVMRQKSQFFD